MFERSNLIVVLAGGGQLPHLLITRLQSRNLSFIVMCEKNFYQSKYERIRGVCLDSKQQFFFSVWNGLQELLALRMKYFFRKLVFVCVGKFYKLATNQHGKRLLNKKSDEQHHNFLRFLCFLLRISIVSPRVYLSEDCVPSGLLVGNPSDLTDDQVNYYVQKSLQMTHSDVGQAVFFMDRNPIAVEGIEGTDRAIRRVGKMVGPGWVLVKLKKDIQSVDLDLPTIGPYTIQQIYRYQGRGLVIDSQHTLFVDKEKTLLLARQLGIFIYGF